MSDIINFNQYRQQKEAQRMSDRLDGAAECDYVEDLFDGWVEFDANVLGDMPIKSGRLYRFESPRQVNTALARLLDRTRAMGLNVVIERNDRDWIFSATQCVPELDRFMLPRTVFETGIRLLKPSKSYSLVIHSNGFWSGFSGNTYQELVPAFCVDPDFGEGGREKSQSELDALRATGHFGLEVVESPKDSGD
ncbi:MAG: hypothetical protein LAT62_13730 [Natronospirillum sp.]|uniref:hypothetical protein n=1 Tax=Natronospirillum sp. TaxID=2812955 RepID=UPI0025D7C35E|nr:hypothetical protein [Natronospirillum sp.]MCH8552992.1 hypothetical protein [Natronospirillum sp.]